MEKQPDEWEPWYPLEYVLDGDAPTEQTRPFLNWSVIMGEENSQWTPAGCVS